MNEFHNKMIFNNSNHFNKSLHADNTMKNLIRKCILKVNYLSQYLEELKKSEEYICIDNINLTNIVMSNFNEYVRKQLLARDNIIHFLFNLLNKFVILHKRSFMWQKIFQSKNKRLAKKVQELCNQKMKLKKFHKKRKCVGKKISVFTQTDDNSYYWDWYYQHYYDNYAKDSDGLGDKISNQDDQPDSRDDGVNEKFPLGETVKQSQIIQYDERIISDNELKQEYVKTSSNSLKLSDIESNSHLPDIQNHILNSDENSSLIKCSNESKKETWNSDNIKEEVEKLAGEITNDLGYVYFDEIGMYYDYSSGYYYDHKTSLYYDSKTGTYFYYDYDTNKYEFHSQVSPNNEEICSSIDTKSKKKKVSLSQDVDKEEGECSDSNDDAEDIEEVNIYSVDKPEIAPSLRLMVINGNLKGSLHVVTLDGGNIGREGDIQVLIKHPSVSKVHAEISYKSNGPNDHHYFIQDLGSINGTTVQGQRLSDSRAKSDPVEVGHGWKIKCGDVIMSCHIHPGLLTCNECEPGLVSVAVCEDATNITLTKGCKKKLEKERRRQNIVIRKKFSLERSENSAGVKNSKSYRDRAGERRETIGSDNPYEKTEVASIDTNIAKTNKGFQLLEKMGWSEGQSLGVNDTGVTEPIIPVCSSGRTGLGCPPSFTIDESLKAKPRFSKRNMLNIMKEKSKLMSSPEISSTPLDSSSTGERSHIKFMPASQDSSVP